MLPYPIRVSVSWNPRKSIITRFRFGIKGVEQEDLEDITRIVPTFPNQNRLASPIDPSTRACCSFMTRDVTSRVMRKNELLRLFSVPVGC